MTADTHPRDGLPMLFAAGLTLVLQAFTLSGPDLFYGLLSTAVLFGYAGVRLSRPAPASALSTA
ncbi:MAG: hypothetical protein AAGI34_01375 [Pseudomonadota bacterium]